MIRVIIISFYIVFGTGSIIEDLSATTKKTGTVSENAYQFLLRLEELVQLNDCATALLKINSNKYKNKYKITKIIIENFALGSSKSLGELNHSKESSSSTFKNINEKSKHFEKKKLFFNIKGKYFEKTYKVPIDTLDNYIREKKILKIDFLKIDTEGYEYEVLNGLKNNFDKVKMIFLEHHYDNMIEKGYKFADINNLLIKNNFIKIFKCKMPFRKTFEYLYQNRL